MHIHRLLSAALCSAFLPVAAAHAQNLIANPKFDHDLSGWIVQEGPVAWSSQDAGSSALSGSMEATGPSGQHESARSNCFAASPGNYLFEFKHREPDPGPSGYGVTAFLRWYSDADCTVLLANSISIGSSFDGPGWQTLSNAILSADAVAPPGTHSAALQLSTLTRAYFDDVLVARVGMCTSTTCLNGGRFAVDVRWLVVLGNGHGTPINVTGDSATYWFFAPGNIELVVKVLNGCALNGHYWVFMAGLTNVHVLVTVTDVFTGETWTYENLLGVPFPPVQDTSAFPCP